MTRGRAASSGIDSWAAELGLPVGEAVARVRESPPREMGNRRMSNSDTDRISRPALQSLRDADTAKFFIQLDALRDVDTPEPVLDIAEAGMKSLENERR
jgi:hypothetical protein